MSSPRRGREGSPGTPRTPPGPPASADVALHRPFRLGFFLALGAFLAWWLGDLILSIGSTLILILVAGFLAAGLNPVVEWLGRRGLGRNWAVLVVITGVVLAVALFVVALVPVISDQVSAIAKSAPGWVDQLQHNRTIQRLDNRYDVLNKAQDALSGGKVGSALFGGVVGRRAQGAVLLRQLLHRDRADAVLPRHAAQGQALDLPVRPGQPA